MNWRDLAQWRDEQGAEFYITALAYGQTLWQQGLSARALLAVDRALYADLNGDEEVLTDYPWPYMSIGWLVHHNPSEVFMGNPRVHYQHLADRVRGDRAEIKKWRAWAAWFIVRTVMPSLPSDPKHAVVEPAFEAINEGLMAHGVPGECRIWQNAVEAVGGL